MWLLEYEQVTLGEYIFVESFSLDRIYCVYFSMIICWALLIQQYTRTRMWNETKENDPLGFVFRKSLKMRNRWTIRMEKKYSAGNKKFGISCWLAFDTSPCSLGELSVSLCCTPVQWCAQGTQVVVVPWVALQGWGACLFGIAASGPVLQNSVCFWRMNDKDWSGGWCLHMLEMA